MLELILTDYTLRVVSLGSMLLGMTSGVLGSFAVIRNENLLGDAVSHAALPGLALAFLLTGSRNSEILLLGALLSGVLATYLILRIVKHSRIKFDSALALILSVFFGAGMVLLTYIQRIPNANQAGLENYIFGQASSLMLRDVRLIAVTGILLLALVLLFWKEFKLVSFDPEYAETLGFSTRRVTALLFIMMVLSIVIGLQTVGVILMSALLTAPGVAARQWTDRLSVMVALSAIFGGLSGAIGTLFSSLIPRLPTGPMIVVAVSVIVVISLFFAPNRGLLWQILRARKNRRTHSADRALSNLYRLASNHGHEAHAHDIYTIDPVRVQPGASAREMVRLLETLEQRGLVSRTAAELWTITEAGKAYVEDRFGLDIILGEEGF